MDDTGSSSDSTSNSIPRQHSRRWMSLAFIYLLAALQSALIIATPYRTTHLYLIPIACALAATLWVRSDLLAQSRRVIPSLLFVFFLTWPIAATVYLIHRSRWRGLLIAVAHCVGIYVTSYLALVATMLTLHYTGTLDERFYSQWW